VDILRRSRAGLTGVRLKINNCHTPANLTGEK